MNAERPIFVLGRPHSGNTMLIRVFQNVAGVLGMIGEESFFERVPSVPRNQPEEAVEMLVESLHKASNFELSEATRDRLRRRLIDECEGRYPISPGKLYRKGVELLLEVTGRKRWVQKSTSYIFYVDDLLDVFPDARILYLLRNPFDIAASLKTRGHPQRIYRMVLGWNRGTRKARETAEEHPGRFRIIRYEDLVGDPRSVVKRTMDFVGLPFSEECLEIARVNPAEEPFRLDGDPRGISDDKAEYYPSVLSASEYQAVRSFSDEQLLETYYPELEVMGTSRVRAMMGRWTLKVQGMVSLSADFAGRFVRHPLSALDRLTRRMG